MTQAQENRIGLMHLLKDVTGEDVTVESLSDLTDAQVCQQLAAAQKMGLI